MTTDNAFHNGQSHARARIILFGVQPLKDSKEPAGLFHVKADHYP
jgi:hypothetical protein